MREILFRGKRVNTGDWVEGYLVIDPQQKPRIYLQPFEGATFNTYFYVVPETVGQFTGLTDTTGQKIFEGDMIEEGTIFFSSDYGGFFVKGNFSEGENHPLYDIPIPKIIGNIHDNNEDKA